MKKVVLGISGGVDSSVAAILLKEQGYEVIGVTFMFTDDFDTSDAKKVCEKLGIKHVVLDYRKEFKKTIIDNFINDYKNGITPNPCVICNRLVKLNFLYKEMIKLNCDYIATGHYAKVINNKLYKSEDLNKDQTYFLSLVPKEILSKLLLPLEGIDKETVRTIARENNLINANKKDSSDVCFINSNFKSYMKDKINNNSGNIINIVTNEIIGKHAGLSNYTIGQRRGINIGGTKDRMFVVGKNVDKNILYIATGNDNDYLISTSCIIDNVNWISDVKPEKCTAKFRYRQNEECVNLTYLENNKMLVSYQNGIKSVTPGQTCTFYLGNECLGGGIIKEIMKDTEKIWYL